MAFHILSHRAALKIGLADLVDQPIGLLHQFFQLFHDQAQLARQLLCCNIGQVQLGGATLASSVPAADVLAVSFS